MTWNYSNTSVQTTLSAPIAAGDTSIVVGSASGLPVTFPFSVVIDYQLASVEVVTVTAASGTTLTVTRGQDGTSAQSHAGGAVVVHGVVARDLQEPQNHQAASGNIHGVGAPSAVVGTATSQTLTNKTISGASNTLSNIGNAAVTDLAASKLTGNFNGGSNFVSTADGTVPLTSTGTATATGNLIEAYKGATRKCYVDPSGNVNASGSVTAGTSISAGTSVSAATSVTATTTVTGTTGVTAGTTVTGQGTGDVVAIVADVPNANVSDLAQFKRNATVKAKIDKDGNGTVNNLTANGTLGVTGAATLSSTLGVTGTSTLGTTNATDLTTSSSLTLGSSTFSVDGKSYARGLLASGSRTAGDIADFSSEKVVVTVGSVTFKNTRAYRVEVGGWGTISSSTAPLFFYIKDNAGGTTYLSLLAGPILSTVGDSIHNLAILAKNNSGSDVTRTIKLVALGSVNHTFRGTAGQPAWVKIWDIGAASDHAEAIQI